MKDKKIILLFFLQISLDIAKKNHKRTTKSTKITNIAQ